MKRGISRRKFFVHSACQAGILALGGSEAARAAADAAKVNPFAYNLERVSQTDPKLIGFEEVSRFACPHRSPRRVAVDAAGRIYLALSGGISVVDTSGVVLEELALPEPARCVAVGNDGVMYAGLRDHVEVFEPRQKRWTPWESPGKRAWLTGLAVSEREVFVADAGNRVVLRYDKSGKLLNRIGEKNRERNVPGLIVPSPYLDVALGADGLLRVNNPGRHCIEAYTKEGALELSWGKPSAAIEGFCGCCNPIAVAMLSDGRLVTCEKGLPRVKVYSATGMFESVVAGPESFPQNAKAGAARDLSDGTLGGWTRNGRAGEDCGARPGGGRGADSETESLTHARTP